MRTPSPGIAPEGLPVIGLAAFATLILALLGWALPALLLLVFSAFSLFFFRDPVRVPPIAPEGKAVAVSPADGRIVSVGPAPDPFTGEQRTRVCVFMNVFNVHVNRAPVAARVRAIRYNPGKFINASFDKASEYNERCAVGLRDAAGRDWTVVQIAGLIARRIVCRTEPGDALDLGDRFGLIMFGSRVDVYLPDDYVSKLRIGDKVLAGMTVLAEADLAPVPAES
ncbi:MAG: phosphatidylserine decarboxylase family protein [Desulfovibrionaceae bacterium]